MSMPRAATSVHMRMRTPPSLKAVHHRRESGTAHTKARTFEAARTLQVSPTLLHRARSRKHAAGVRIFFAALRAGPSVLAAAGRQKERLQVVAVEVSATKHQHLRHTQLVDLRANTSAAKSAREHARAPRMPYQAQQQVRLETLDGCRGSLGGERLAGSRRRMMCVRIVDPCEW